MERKYSGLTWYVIVSVKYEIFIFRCQVNCQKFLSNTCDIGNEILGIECQYHKSFNPITFVRDNTR